MGNIAGPASMQGHKNLTENLLEYSLSPWHLASSKVKALFKQPSLLKQQIQRKKVQITVIQNIWEARKGKVNACGNVIMPEDYFIKCRSCCLEREEEEFGDFCFECFDQVLHKGHDFRVVTMSEEDEPEMRYCDCGRRRCLSLEFCCQAHRSIETLEPEMNIMDQNGSCFFNFFEGLYQIQAFLHTQGIATNISEEIYKVLKLLLADSIYYSRLLAKVFTSPINFNTKPYFLLQFLTFFDDIETLLRFISQDLASFALIAKAYIPLKPSSVSLKKKGEWIFSLFQQEELLQKLAEQGIYLHSFPSYYTQAASSLQFGSYLTENFLRSQSMRLKSTQQKVVLFKSLSKIQTSNKLLSKQTFFTALSLYPFQSDLDEKRNAQQLFKVFHEGRLFEEIRSAERKIFKLILPMSIYCPKKIIALRSELSKINLSPEVLQIPLASVCTQSLGLIQPSKLYQSIQIFITAFLLLLQSPNSQKMVSKFWEFSLQNNVGFTIPCLLVASVLGWIIRIPVYIAKAKMRVGKPLTSQQESMLSVDFTCFLRSKKDILASIIWDKDLSKELCFSDAKGILFSNCKSFENQFAQTMFKYEPKGHQDSQSYLFQIVREIEDFDGKAFGGNCTNLNIGIDKKIQVEMLEDYQMQILELLLNGDQFFNQLKQLWANHYRRLHSNNPFDLFVVNLESEHSGCIYVVIILMIAKLLNGKGTAYEEELTKIASDQKYRKQFQEFAPQGKISQMLCIKRKNKKTEKSKYSEGGEDLKKRQLQKKERLFKEFKKKQQKIFREAKEQSQDKQKAHELEQCLLCHESENSENEMIYLTEVNRGRTLASSVHTNSSKANTLISMCFHPLHLRCYFTLQDDPTNIDCPLCGHFSNCIMPASDDPSKRLERICQNVMISSMVRNYKLFDVQSSSILAVRHLVEAMGLNPLLSLSQYERGKFFCRKVNKFVWNFLQRVYKGALRTQKFIFENEFKQIIEQIDLCQDNLIKALQKLLAKIVWVKLAEENISQDQEVKKLLAFCKNQMVSQEFDIIVSEINAFIGKEWIQDMSITSYFRQRSLSVDLSRLPGDMEGLSEFWTKRPKCCKQNDALNAHLCLLCSNFVCKGCGSFQRHLFTTHHCNCLFVEMRGSTLHCYKSSRGQDSIKLNDLYTNQFTTPYSYAQSRKSNLDLKSFKLNQSCLTIGLQKFLN